MKPTERTSTIEGLDQAGDGYTHLDGRSVRVAGTLPGERVRLCVTGPRAELLSVESSVQGRVEPPCPVFNSCGGCSWQHMAPDLQRSARLDQLRRALPSALRDLPVSYHPSPVGYGWRSRARLAWRVVRTGTVLGFRGKGTTDVVDAPGCMVLVPTLSAALAVLREALGTVGRSGEVSLALGLGGRPVASIHPDGNVAQGYAVLAALVAQGFAGASLWVPGATAPATEGDPRPVVSDADGLALVLAPDGFSQSNAALNPALARYVAAQANVRGRSVTELHAGAGNFTVLLADGAQRVTAVESDLGAVDALRTNLAVRSLGNVTVRHGTAESAAVGLRSGVVVLDPPRTGAREVAEALVRGSVRRLVYVSCDPPTLGRDLGILSARYEVATLAMFEMFPQTPHAEVVATLVPARGGSGGRSAIPGATPDVG